MIVNPEPTIENERASQLVACEWMSQRSIVQDPPEHLRAVNRMFCELSAEIMATIEPSPERTVALRKLLESKYAVGRVAMKEKA